MEVTGIEGNYRLTCERVLCLLRNNNDSILAVLEAFVYDPVLNWRLAERKKKIFKKNFINFYRNDYYDTFKTCFFFNSFFFLI